MLAKIGLELSLVCFSRGSAIGIDELLHDGVSFVAGVGFVCCDGVNCTPEKISCNINFSIDDAGLIDAGYGAWARARVRVCARAWAHDA